MSAIEAALQVPGGWLPLALLAIMGLAMLAYVILDGYDLGVGTLLSAAGDRDKDTMVASIGPFWDANETWLVLGVGIPSLRVGSPCPTWCCWRRCRWPRCCCSSSSSVRCGVCRRVLHRAMPTVTGCVVLPIIAGYTVFSYLAFRGKATALQY